MASSEGERWVGLVPVFAGGLCGLEGLLPTPLVAPRGDPAALDGWWDGLGPRRVSVAAPS